MALQETHVFTNQGGGVTIVQKMWPDPDQTITIFGDQVELVMLELQKLLSENKFTMEMDEEEGEKK